MQNVRRHPLRQLWHAARWPALVLLFAGQLALGAYGWARYFHARAVDWSLPDVVYRSMQLFVLEGGNVSGPVPWALQLARFTAPLVLAYTAISTLALVFLGATERLRIRRSRHQVVICGLGRRGLELTRALREHRTQVVVIELDSKNNLLAQVREAGALVLTGDATDPATLRAARVDRASHLVALCGDDGTNATIALLAGRLTAERPSSSLACIAHLGDPDLSALLRSRELTAGTRPGFTLEFFDVYELGARILLRDFAPPALGAADRSLHLVVVGLGRLGASLVRELARARHASAPDGKSVRIVVVDRAGEAKVATLLARHPEIATVCALEALPIEVESASFEEGGFLCGPDTHTDVDAAYVCLDNDDLGMTAALTLQRRLGGSNTPVVVRVSRASGLATLLDTGAAAAENVHAFPLLERTCTPELVMGGTYERLARAIHNRYRRFTGVAHEKSGPLAARVPWEDLDEQYRTSSRAEAVDIGRKLRSLGFGIGPLTAWDAPSLRFSAVEVERLAELEHERWMDERAHAGWHHAPGATDPIARTSPWLVPWTELPESARDIDRDAVRAIPELLAEAGFQVVPLTPVDE
jgi:voltage-gated potassium channel Kch